jgi:hypothetical protein
MLTRSWPLSTLVAVLALGCSTGTQANDATSTNRSAPGHERGSESRQRSNKRLGYSWTLPKGWEFADPGLFWKLPPTPALDVSAAQHSPDGPFVLMLVRKVIHTVPGKHPGDDPKDYDKLERDAADELRRGNAETILGARRIQTFGTETVEVTGEQDELRSTIRTLFVGYRKFEFRCYQLSEQSGSECGTALSGLMIEDLPEPTEQDVPRVRHLRDARFGVAFDAPDDSWLSIGPYDGYGDAQVVWLWLREKRQIDVQVMDLEAMPSQPGQAFLAAEMARNSRASGRRVLEKRASFAGQSWEHHEMSSKGHGAQDLFVLVQQGVMYALLVTQPTRDQNLVEAVKKGFRLIPKSLSSSSTHVRP